MLNSKCLCIFVEKEISFSAISDCRFSHFSRITESYSEPFQTSKVKPFVKMDNGWKPLIIFAKSAILDV